jgi:triosephosphate isomerase
MRKKIVAGNWKMNTNLQAGLELAKEINEKLKNANIDCEKTGIVIAPPFSHIYAISQIVNTEKICIAAQNCASESSGAFTGEISAEMLQSIGCKAVIIGHSERRAYYHESNEILFKKVKLVLENNMKPIFCCGEVLAERQSNIHFNVVKKQLDEVIFKLSVTEFEKIIIAYEPVWAIGTGVTATSDQAQEMHAYIRNLITDKYGKEIAQNKTILYGGSCNSKNAKELFTNNDVDGGLIGGASLKADDFLQIINSF